MAAIVGAGLIAGLGGCSNRAGLFQETDGQWFNKPMAVFAREDGSSAVIENKNLQLTPTAPVPPDELVGADGRCSAPAAEAAPAQTVAAASSADRPVGSIAGDLAGAPMPAAATPAGLDPANPSVASGIALGMTECETVRRAGLPSNVSVGVGDSNDRKVVLTYLTGNWPGIYSFASGRLKEISAAPVQPKPVKPAPKKKAKAVVKPAPASAPVTRIQ